MTLKSQIISDISAAFINTDEFGYSAVWTPQDGIAQPAFNVIYDDIILHGDPEQENPVIQPETTVMAATTDVENVKEYDTIQINGIIFEAIGASYVDPHNSGMSLIDLRMQTETRI